MGIYNQARRWALTVMCSAVALAGLSVAAPGSASAAVCITGSGSSLQGEQQTLWTGVGGFACGAETVEYLSTSSGKGLSEFGISPSGLKVAESGNGTKLDAFVGTDDAPTLTELANTKGGAGTAETTAWTAPVVAAPIAVIMHLPSGCKLKTGVTLVVVSPIHLSEVFAGGTVTWATLLGSNVEGTCTGIPMRDVRSDASGTSFAFKQFLCKAGGVAVWANNEECESGLGFVVDAATWPKEAEVGKVILIKHLNKAETEEIENKGSAGEAEAVENEEGSIGYVNLANAAKTPGKFVSAKTGATIFWVDVEDHLKNGQNPEKGTKEGNCPGEYEFPTGVQKEAEEGMWAKVHLASTGSSGAYPICTFTYDIGWESYATTELKAKYGAGFATVGTDTKEYFEYMTSPLKGQAKIAEYYSPLPTTVAPGNTKSVQEIAEEIATTHIG
ncbi:MAG TPA: substrate-binding domain-containing protein [Solirubrobacteraceae bacterium]|jgi:ABC-type phosphate transport system substrate-binding protein